MFMTLALEILLRDFNSNLDFIRKEQEEIIVSFSGGKDSTILLNLVRKFRKPEDKIKVKVYAENFYPEIAAFIQKQKKIGEELGENWVIKSTGWNLWRVWKEYGIFGHSKFIMRTILNIQSILDNENWKGWKYDKYKALEVYRGWLSTYGLEHIFNDIWEGNKRFRADFRGKNNSCCNLVKNSQTKHDKWELTGMRAEESGRGKIFCKDKDKKALNIMKNWTEDNEKEAMKELNIDICEIYKYLKRTGCMFCPFAGNKAFNWDKEKYYDKLSEENKKIVDEMEEVREYFKPRRDNTKLKKVYNKDMAGVLDKENIKNKINNNISFNYEWHKDLSQEEIDFAKKEKISPEFVKKPVKMNKPVKEVANKPYLVSSVAYVRHNDNRYYKTWYMPIVKYKLCKKEITKEEYLKNKK